MRLLLLTLLLAAASARAQGTGTLAGTVRDGDTGEWLSGANVRVAGTTLGAATNADGVYRIIGVPIGTYTVTASSMQYHPLAVDNVAVENGYTREVSFAIVPGPLVDSPGVRSYRIPLIVRDPFSSRVLASETLQVLPIGR